MKERGLLMSAPMVRATMREIDPKLQTRRIVRGQQPTWASMALEEDINGREFAFAFGARETSGEHAGLSPILATASCQHGQVGDRLWVREHWRTLPLLDAMPPREIPSGSAVWFDADGDCGRTFGRFRPGMFMPRWASRITLEITEVRVERLQDISEADAIAEGLIRVRGPLGSTMWEYSETDGGQFADPRVAYHMLWDSINGLGSWDANQWVFVICFRRLAGGLVHRR